MRRFVVVMTVWAMGLAGVLTSVVFPSPASAASTTAGAYVSLAPSRLLNTLTGVGARMAAVPARGTVHLKVTGRGGIPGGVSAVVLNVSVVAPTSAGYITAHAGGTARPGASNLNFVKGQTVPNLVIAPVGAGGVVDLYNGSAGTTQLVADVSGYFVPAALFTPFLTTAGAFGSLAPSRLLSSLTGVGAPKVAVPARGTVHLKVTGRGGVPASGVSAVVLNVAVVAPTSGGYITAHAGGTGRPTASNLNFVKGQTVPNLVIAPVGAGGVVDLHNGSAGTVKLVADVSGYFLSGAPTTPGAFGSLAPSRLLNSLTGVGAPKAAVKARGTVHLQVAGRGGVPTAGVSAVVLNVSVVAPTSAGYITAHGGGTARPGASNLNFVKGQTIPNLVIAPVGLNGKVDLYNGSAGTTQLVADVSGYYMGTPRAALPPVVARPVVTPPVVPPPVVRPPVVTTIPSISGTVTESGSSHRLAGVVVNVSKRQAPDFEQIFVKATTTAADGSYTVTGLEADDYHVCFDASGATGGTLDPLGYLDQCYNSTWTEFWPTTVYVTKGAATTGINAALVGAGAISGTVTDAATHGLANVQVRVDFLAGVYSQYRNFVEVTTGADGTWSVPALRTGQYQVCFTAFGAVGGSSDARGYVDQCYNNQRWLPAPGCSLQPGCITGTPVAVTHGKITAGINAALVGAGAISGTVTDSQTTPHGLAGVSVRVSSPSSYSTWDATTDVQGNYTVTGLPAGTEFKVCFDGSLATGDPTDPAGYIDQCYDNMPTSGASTPVTVTLGATKTGVNAELAVGGAISGTVTDAVDSRHGLADVDVRVYSPSTGAYGGATTALDGTWSVTGLVAGADYKVCFYDSGATGGSSDALGYLTQCWQNQPEFGITTPVAVSVGATKPGIDAALVGAGAISGTVTDARGIPLDMGGGSIMVSVQSPTTGAQEWASLQVDDTWSVTGLVAGTDYKVCFHYSEATSPPDLPRFVSQCWQDQPEFGTPTPVGVNAGATTPGINAALAGPVAP